MIEFLKQKVWQPILHQIKQGVTPHLLSLSIALGVVLTLFPVFGTTVTLCVFFGFIFKLNQPTVIAINYIMTPLQLIAIPVQIRLGESLLRMPHVSLNPTTIVQEFWASPMAFIGVYGKSTLAAILVWLILAGPLTWIIYKVSHPIMNRVTKR